MGSGEVLPIARALRAHKFKLKLCRQFKRKALQQYKLNCQGCNSSACCYQLLMACLFEGVLIADKLRSLGRDDLIRDFEKVGAMQLKLLRSDHWEPLLAPPERATSRWFDLQIQCPLLVQMDNGNRDRCMCYQLRPSCCALYLAVRTQGVTASNCEPPSGKAIAAVNSAEAHAHIIWADSQFASELFGAQMLITPLPAGIMVGLGDRILKKDLKSAFDRLNAYAIGDRK
jgi:hypothetical protein